MKRTLLPIIFSVFFLFALIASFAISVSADTLPCIMVCVENAPEDNYYIALLSGENVLDELPAEGPDSFEPDEQTIEEYLEAFNYNGLSWCRDRSPSGVSFFSSNEYDRYYFYVYPEQFRVILVSESGPVLISSGWKYNNSDAENRDCSVTLDCSTGTLTECKDNYSATSVSQRILRVLYFLVATLVLEWIIFKLFSYPETKHNIISFVVINVLTNIPQIYLSRHGLDLGAVITGFVVEIFIVIIEAGWFYVMLQDEDGNSRAGRSIGFSITANFFSVFWGCFIAYLLFMLYGAIYHFH